MKILSCQISPRTGDLEYNYNLIKTAYNSAKEKKADICLLPELSICGYMSEDLFLQKNYLLNIEKFVNKLISETKETCLLISTPYTDSGVLFNAVIACQNERIIGITYKKHLPNYGIFDEKRYFSSGPTNILKINGHKVGVAICEDAWHADVCLDLKNHGAEILLIPNASPFEKTKIDTRIKIIKKRFEETNLPIVYCNQVQAQDGIVFDGNSFFFDNSLNITGYHCKTNTSLITLKNNSLEALNDNFNIIDPDESIYTSIKFALQEYVNNNGFKKVILGLSGGIDSALVACIAARSLGPENVTAYILPTKFNSRESYIDATNLADNLGIKTEVINIQETVDQLSKSTNIDVSSIAHQNLQSRIRGAILMAKSNQHNALLLTTGNKSEYATGYATIYGDMNGAFNPIKDLYKTEVFELANYINKNQEIIPSNIISKEPSAELACDQKDSDSLPPYEVLDKILYEHIENNLDQEELQKLYPPEIVTKIVSLVKNSEFKRKQATPGVKLSSMSFDKDRRFPITNAYK